MILLGQELLKRMVEHAGVESPKEACGIIAGTKKGGNSVVEKVYNCRNVDPSPSNRYKIDPKEQLEVMEEIDRSGMELLGFYHSHPGGPGLPSEIDLERVMWPGHSHLILSLSPEVSVTSWLPEEGKGFSREEIKIVEENYKSRKDE